MLSSPQNVMPSEVKGPGPPALRSTESPKSSLTLLPHHLLISGQRDEREVLAVEVVHQVEDAREAGSGVPGLVPGAVFLLGFQNIGDAFCDRFAARVVAASSPMTAHAVCEGVLGPMPLVLGSS